jgi:glycosyltransferase involved in cell wall biosynthesis
VPRSCGAGPTGLAASRGRRSGLASRPLALAAHLAVDGSGLARPWAGVGTYTREILAALADARPEARFTVYAPEGSLPAHRGISLRRPPAARFVGRHLQWPLQLRALRASAYFGAAGVMPLAKVGLPAVVTANDMAIYRHPEWFPGRQTLSVRLIVPRSMRRADAVVAVSRHTAADVGDLLGVPVERLHVVPEGVGPQYRPLPREELAAVGRRYDLPERFVLFVSTIEPRKNLETLLDAWSILRGRPPLVVAGGWGWRYEEVQRRLDRAPEGVRLLGSVRPAELPALYNLATCLAHPAWYEGFGLTPLEAMACGTPVVASSASSLPEVVGDAGLLVPPGDPDGWRDALERLLDDAALRGRLKDHGLRRASEFTWQKAAAATWQVLDKVLQNSVSHGEEG